MNMQYTPFPSAAARIAVALFLPYECVPPFFSISQGLVGKWTDTTVYNDSSRVLIHELDFTTKTASSLLNPSTIKLS
jgi:hypothetical protein